MEIESKLAATIRKYALLSPGDRVLVGVSGGPDSVALLHLLVGLQSDFNLHLEVAHLIHGVRGVEAAQDARFVARLAKKLGLRFHLKEVNIPAAKIQRGRGNIEAIGRKERYEFFASVMRQTSCGKVATGHTRDDQVETLLMWILRGGGRRALGGIPPIRALGDNGPPAALAVIRPLIETSKKEVIAYLNKKGIPFRQDKTNLDASYLRNWIRLRLLPELRRRTDYHLDIRLAQLCDLLWEEEKVLQGFSRARLQRVVRNYEIDARSFLREEKALRRRLLRLWLDENGGDILGLSFDHVEACLRLIAEGPAQGRVSLPRAWEVAKEYGVVRLQKRQFKIRPVGYNYRLIPDKDLVIREAGVRIRTSIHPRPTHWRPKNDWEAVFDLQGVAAGLSVRNFRAGDRFRPLGMRGQKKIKELFIDRKVPAEIRRKWPFLLAGSEILWIPGYGRSDAAKVGPNTKKVLRAEAQIERS
ncbi:MAG: tRNA lysidine(34) synthetase TilS [Candidatus Binatia bacterium]